MKIKKKWFSRNIVKLGSFFRIFLHKYHFSRDFPRHPLIFQGFTGAGYPDGVEIRTDVHDQGLPAEKTIDIFNNTYPFNLQNR